jgi:predicted DCC family thiol-disulfide oxidoreductase YuxK
MTPESNAEITADPSPMLVYEGSCGFCSHSVQFLLRHERRHDLSFVTRNSELGKELRRIHGLESVESMLWIEGGQAFAESDAVMKAADYLGGWWCRLAVLGSFCPSFILNGVYRFIAKNRRRLSSRAAVCPDPSPEQRNRFLA